MGQSGSKEIWSLKRYPLRRLANIHLCLFQYRFSGSGHDSGFAYRILEFT